MSDNNDYLNKKNYNETKSILCIYVRMYLLDILKLIIDDKLM